MSNPYIRILIVCLLFSPITCGQETERREVSSETHWSQGYSSESSSSGCGCGEPDIEYVVVDAGSDVTDLDSVPEECRGVTGQIVTPAIGDDGHPANQPLVVGFEPTPDVTFVEVTVESTDERVDCETDSSGPNLVANCALEPGQWHYMTVGWTCDVEDELIPITLAEMWFLATDDVNVDGDGSVQE